MRVRCENPSIQQCRTAVYLNIENNIWMRDVLIRFSKITINLNAQADDQNDCIESNN